MEIKLNDLVRTKRNYIGRVVSVYEDGRLLLDIGKSYLIRSNIDSVVKIEGVKR